MLELSSENESNQLDSSAIADFSIMSACVDRLTSILRKHLNKTIEDDGINYSHWRVLHTLMFDDAKTPAQLAKRIYVETAAITHCLDKLESLGYITRSRGAGDDRRITQITVTDSGKNVTIKGLRCATSLLSTICENLGPEQIVNLNSIYQQSLKLTL